jgi:hypothetical protein
VPLLLERNRNGVAIGSCRFRADIDDVGAFLDKPPRLRERSRRLEEAAPVGE